MSPKKKYNLIVNSTTSRCDAAAFPKPSSPEMHLSATSIFQPVSVATHITLKAICIAATGQRRGVRPCCHRRACAAAAQDIAAPFLSASPPHLQITLFFSASLIYSLNGTMEKVR